MIHLLELSSFQQYLYDPQTWLHKISNSIKLIILFLYLFFLFYSSINFLILINLCLITMFFTLFIPISSFDFIFNRNLIFYFIFFFTCIGSDSIANFSLRKNNYTIFSIKLSYKKIIHKTNCLLINKYSISVKIHILVSQHIQRFVGIIISSILLHKLLILTTYNKDILCFYKTCHISNDFNIYNHILFILMLSSEWIYLFEIKIKNLCIAFQLRGLKLMFFYQYINSFKIFIIGFNILIAIIFKEAKYMTQSIYSREIISEEQQVWLI
uniref:Transmembrane protein n=1 Tax=Batrachospermum sp. TaxID=31373 RepID=A0A8K1YUR9_9FLOR|nr:Hypothetical protein Ycf92 [Batrachospermum sp.]